MKDNSLLIATKFSSLTTFHSILYTSSLDLTKSFGELAIAFNNLGAASNKPAINKVPANGIETYNTILLYFSRNSLPPSSCAIFSSLRATNKSAEVIPKSAMESARI